MKLKRLVPIIAAAFTLNISTSMASSLSDVAPYSSHGKHNLINNPSFENKGLGWSYWFANIKSDDAYSGTYRGRIAQGKNHYIAQTITVPKTGYYDLSAYVRSPNDNAKMGLRNLANETLISTPLQQSQRYKYNRLKNIPLEKGETLQVFFSGSSKGGVSVDDVSLHPSSKNKPLNFNQVVAFGVEQQSGETIINRNKKHIQITLPYGTDLENIRVSNAQYSSGTKATIKTGDIIDASEPMIIKLVNEKGKTQRWKLTAIEQEKEVTVTSSNQKLQDSFGWAIEKTRQFVMTGQNDLVNRDEFNNDGSGTADYIPSYWAGYFDRTAFYSRDFLHQAAGAQLAGLDIENFSMFQTFAKHSTESRKWYTLWAVNFDGSPHTIDYKHDEWFVREVPAQFEFIEKAWEQYQWTGNKRYLEDPDLWRFYTKVLTDYIALHDDQDPNGIAEGYGGIFEGSATYNERGEFPIEAGDGIGSQYQATVAYAAMLEAKEEYGEAKIWQEKAQQLKGFFNQQWSDAGSSDPLANYVNIVQKDGFRMNDFGKENSWFMPMKLITEPGARNDRYLDFIAENLGNGIGSTPQAPHNIEAYTYIPETYFPYNRNEEAWKWMQYIMDVKDLPHERPTQGTNGDYPEISFTFISNTIEGLMGIKPDAANKQIITASHLTHDIDWLAVDNLIMGNFELTIQHEGIHKTTLTNKSEDTLTWQAWFYGVHPTLLVNGTVMEAQHQIVNGQPVSYVDVSVAGDTTQVVETVPHES
ncbi:hypothetical protein L4C36_12040 [Photobacterium japonica]|uniref:hypothetical protein n=1 Tax=Photobacterium japonica TaxID=2910235 RepID=UPI003D147EEB